MPKLSATQEQVLHELAEYGGYIAAFHNSAKDGGTEYKMMVGSVEHRGLRRDTLDALIAAKKSPHVATAFLATVRPIVLRRSKMPLDHDGNEIKPGDLVTHVTGQFTGTQKVKEVGAGSVTIDWATSRIPVFAAGLVRVVKQ